MAVVTGRTQAFTTGSETIILKNNDGGVNDQVGITSTDAAGKTTTEFTDLTDESRAALYSGLANSFGVGVGVDGEGNEVLFALSPEQQGQLSSVVAALTDPAATNANIQGRWADFVAQVKVNGPEDVNALVQQVLREAYTEATEDLGFYAQKVQFYNDLKKEIRDQLSTARKELATYAGKPDEFRFASTLSAEDSKMFSGVPGIDPESGKLTIVKEDPGELNLTAGADGKISKEELQTFSDNLEERLNSVGDDSQLANVDLQNMLQKQQQTLQMMSNISKMLNDTAMAVIRKIGG